MKKTLVATSLAAALTLAGSAAFAAKTYTGAAKDAWIAGKVETAFVLNARLNPFTIDTDVDNGVVHLTGTVKDPIDRDLAGQVAKGVEGVTSVKNDIKTDARAAETAAHARSTTAGKAEPGNQTEGEHRTFGTWVADATMTARVKSNLIGDKNIKASKIDVDTAHEVVTLSGRVSSSSEKSLAEQIAKNTPDVKAVKNNLVVDPS